MSSHVHTWSRKAVERIKLCSAVGWLHLKVVRRPVVVAWKLAVRYRVVSWRSLLMTSVVIMAVAGTSDSTESLKGILFMSVLLVVLTLIELE